MTTIDKLKDPEFNLELGDEKPNLQLIVRELEASQTDAIKYFQRNANAFDLYYSRWDGQTIDGRKHAGNDEEDCFPWEGAADGRLRTCERATNEWINLVEYAFDQAKIQAQSVREFANGRQVNQATQLLRWQLAHDLRPNLQREVPLAAAWTGKYGSALLEVAWEQSKRLDFIEITVPDLADVMMNGGDQPDWQTELMQLIVQRMPAVAQILAAQGDPITALADIVNDPGQEKAMSQFLQQLSPILDSGEALRIVRDLRQVRNTKIPVANVIYSRPRWTALRPMVDVQFPAEMDDPQNPDTRWMNRVEYITETEAIGRIDTDHWDEAFVDELLQHKGEITNERWLRWTAWERTQYYAAGTRTGGIDPMNTSYKDLVEVYHFRYRAHAYGTPCLYKTVFSPHVLSNPKRRTKDPLFATHGPDDYDHGRYPFAAIRYEQLERPLLSSRGIPEIIYTWEMEEKVQSDGVIDRTSLVLQPPMFAPNSRVEAIRGKAMPRAILGVTRPNELAWMPLPQFDNTPFQVMDRIQARIDRHMALFGAEVDQELKNMRRQRVVKRWLNQVSIAVQMTLELDQQFIPDADTADIVGTLQRPFHMDRKDIQGAHQISASIDMNDITEDGRQKKLELIGQAMQYNQGGTANVNRLFQLAMEAIDPDLADAIVEDPQVATDREKNDELGAIGQAFAGIEPPIPQFGNHQLRLQVLTQNVFQSQNPEMPKRLMQNPDSAAILQRRAKQFQDLIQQYQNNPAIGRAVGTQALNPRMAPELTSRSDQ